MEVKKKKNSEKEFIEFVRKECKEHGIKLDLRNTRSVSLGDNSRCAGYFDIENKVLVSSMNRPDSFGILVHEYCHMTQWAEDIPLWRKSNVALFKLWSWLEGEEVKNIKKYIAIARDLELDNEKRAVKIIKKFNLNIDTREYIKKANAYIHYYNWLLYSRKWSKASNSPYRNKIILEAMSDKFNMKYSELTDKLYKLYEQEKI